MTSKYYYYFTFIFIGLLISLLLNQDRMIRTFYNNDQRHAVPIASNKVELGDDYHYYVEANDSLSLGFTEKNNVYSTNNILLGALFTSGLINSLSQKLFYSSDKGVLISLILQTFILVLATLCAIKILGRYEGVKSIFSLGFWTFLALVLSEFFLFNSYVGKLHSRALLSYYPNILRVVNPQIGWAYGLFYFALIVNYIDNKSSLKFIILCILSLLFSIYSFSLCLTMLIAIAMFISLDYISKRKIDYPFLLLLLFLMISFLFNYIQLQYFQMSPKGQEVNTGLMKDIIFRWHYFILLLLIWPINYYYKGKQRFFLYSVLISSLLIGAFCETLHLGGRLWIRGAGVYVLILCTVLLSNWIKTIFKYQMVSVLCFLFVSIWTYFLLPHHFNNDYGYMDSDKWLLIDWINKNTVNDSIIMSDDLEFSFLLPIYTHSKPFVPLFSLSNQSTEEIVKKYYYTLEQFGTKEETLEKLKTFTRKKFLENLSLVAHQKALDEVRFTQAAFFNGLIYYPYTNFSRLALSTENNTKNFFSTLNAWSKEKYQGNKDFNYLIVKSNSLSKVNKKIIFQTNKYLLLTN